MTDLIIQQVNGKGAWLDKLNWATCASFLCLKCKISLIYTEDNITLSSSMRFVRHTRALVWYFAINYSDYVRFDSDFAITCYQYLRCRARYARQTLLLQSVIKSWCYHPFKSLSNEIIQQQHAATTVSHGGSRARPSLLRTDCPMAFSPL